MGSIIMVVAVLEIHILSTAEAAMKPIMTIADPLYYVNKGIWHFNDFVFLYIGEPAARGYNKILPETIRGGVTNFFSNWYTPVRLVSCLLQAKWEEAGTESGHEGNASPVARTNQTRLRIT